MKLNKTRGWVGLEGLKLKGPVGVYEAEQKKGTELLIDISVFGKLGKAIKSDSIEGSMNYEILSTVATEEVKAGAALLETLAHRILVRVLKEIPKAKIAEITLRKLKPSLDSTARNSFVALSLER